MLQINHETRIHKIVGVIRVYNGREPRSIIHYGDLVQRHELIYKWSGDSVSRLGDQEYALSEGSILYIPQGWKGTYSVTTLHKGEAIDILFKTNTPLAARPVLLPAPHKPSIIKLFEKSHELWRTGGEQEQLRCLAMLYSLLAEIEEETSRQHATPRMQVILDNAIQYLNAHCFDENIDYAQLSYLSGVSYSYLKKLFVAHYGIPPSRYVIQRRMAYAKTLLLAPELSVTQISSQVGYSSVYYFSRVFRMETGMTPTEYRKNM